MIELRHLRMIQALVETGSVSAAAERVHLTQSALSHQLGALERYFGWGQTRLIADTSPALPTSACPPGKAAMRNTPTTVYNFVKRCISRFEVMVHIDF